METLARRADDGLTPRAIFRKLDRYVIGQDEAKRAMAIAAYIHTKRVLARRQARSTLLRKSNVLLVGPTGSGKTHLARTLATVLAVPFATVDATEYTEAGYYGKDVEGMISELLHRAGQVVEEAETGIVFVDEIDKIARRSQSANTGAGARDIGGEGVQQALLKLLEGREVTVPVQGGTPFTRHEFVRVNTHDILFVCAGAFSDLFGVNEEKGAKAIGFGTIAGADQQIAVTLKQLTDYGLLPELLGRTPVIVTLERLTVDELVRILTEPPDALTREFRELLALDGIDLRFTPSALTRVATHAVERGLGARALRAILEHVLSEILFEAPETRKRAITVDLALVKRRLREMGRLTL